MTFDDVRAVERGAARRNGDSFIAGLVLVLATITGCGPAITRTRVELPPGGVAPPTGRHVEMHYLGNGGWVFRRGKDAIATAPFVSNPSGLAVYLPSSSNVRRVRDLIPPMPDVTTMLIGHSHYDHAMDLPTVMNELAPSAHLYGSVTANHVLAGAVDKTRREVIKADQAAVGKQPGEWLPLDWKARNTVRFMPLTSSHAPHFLGMKLVSAGRLEQDLSEPPSIPACWPEGETFAYLIDFLRPDGSVEFRIYYQDAAAKPDDGGIPKLPPAEDVPVDVAILCVAGFSEVPRSPRWILENVKPRTVLGGHWEDFFMCPCDSKPRVAPGTSLDEFIDEAQEFHKAPVQIPGLFEKVYFPLDR